MDTEHTLLEHCGTFFPDWLPEGLWAPPEDLAERGADRTWYKNRATLRYSQHRPPRNSNGKLENVRLICPVHSGRWDPEDASDSYINDVRVDGPPDGQSCCEGTVELPAEYRDFYQVRPYGTKACKDSYSRRTQVENRFGIIKDKFGLVSRIVPRVSPRSTRNRSNRPYSCPQPPPHSANRVPRRALLRRT